MCIEVCVFIHLNQVICMGLKPCVNVYLMGQDVNVVADVARGGCVLFLALPVLLRVLHFHLSLHVRLLYHLHLHASTTYAARLCVSVRN